VDVHVPEAGDQKLARRIYHMGLVRDTDVLGEADLSDTIPGDHHGHIGLGGRAGRINHRDMYKDKRW
jgi:hypothetical protein